jgi:hypothetical protein
MTSTAITLSLNYYTLLVACTYSRADCTFCALHHRAGMIKQYTNVLTMQRTCTTGAAVARGSAGAAVVVAGVTP